MKYAFDDEKDQKQNNYANNNKDIWLKLSLDPGETKKTYSLRLIGAVKEFYECTAFTKVKKDVIKDGKVVIKYEDVAKPFEDSATNRRATRVAHENPSECYWTKAGHNRTKRYAQVVLDVTDKDDPKVKLINKGVTFFQDIFKREFEQWENRKDDNGDIDPDVWLFSGGENAPTIKLTIERDESGKNSFGNRPNYKYSFSFASRARKLTEQEVDLLKNTYCPTPEELESFRADAKDQLNVLKSKDIDKDKKERFISYLTYISKAPDWYFSGLPIDKIFAYKLPKQVEVETSEDDLDISSYSDKKDSVELVVEDTQSDISLDLNDDSKDDDW